ncbi:MULTISPECIES: hybrid nucleoside-diphosphate sugar epimerase/sugar transferase [unclassified Nitrobacter]|uniref:hybrid nucleoside-diphosphate sugar epimerase/sugar transferase n=1 Tax=unclassified Nitrobacter TaxID=2620411 RepID=UPI001AC012BA|nr:MULTISPECIES: hybrid nucleoside-diphosphate sugar epimerase/sugar transferase [unclassified Nitrobacter]MBN9146842.1 sugar transferase [Nitrobacter sp.]
MRLVMPLAHSRSQPLRIVVTGAGGSVGRELVPRLVADGANLLLVGRNPVALGKSFSGCKAIGYDEIATRAIGYDMLIHLAVLNNNIKAGYDDFVSVNVDLAIETYRRAREAGVRKFIYVSSIHALDPSASSFYAKTKREATKRLEAMADGDVCTVYLPAVTGEKFSGRLCVLNRLPKSIRTVALALFSTMKPTVSADRIAAAIAEISEPAGPSDARMIVTDGQTENLFFAVCKRIVDLAFAVGVVVLFGWLLIIIGIAIRLESRGPAFFRQMRVGWHQRTFTCFKFRTMYVGTRNTGTHEVSASSVTKLGAFLRRTKIDELPQVLNILMNDMSLVGPRPSLPSQTEVVAARLRRGVYAAKPGITGLSQIRGIDMSSPEKLAISDADYLKLQSIALECYILVQTAIGKGGGDKLRIA